MEPWAPEVADSPFAAGDRSPAAQLDRARRIGEEADRREAAGSFGAFSADDMAHARRALGADPRHDPVAEILGLEPATTNRAFVVPGFTPDEIKALSRTMEEAAAIFQRYMDALVESVQAIGSIFQNLVGIITEAAGDPRSQARRRHGRAAWCPKHGETRGGTCMPCSRGNHR